MKILNALAAAGLLLSTATVATSAQAQDYRGDRSQYDRDHRGGDRHDDRRYDRRHNGWNNHRRCHTEWRHHRQVRICR